MRTESGAIKCRIRTLFFVVLLSAYAIACGPGVILHAPELPSPTDVVIQGHTDYRWKLQTLDGREVDFAAFKNQVVFLNFWATWCPPCTVELPNIERLHESLKTENIAFVISSFEDEHTVRRFASEMNLKLPFYLHGRFVPSIFMSNRGIPVTFVINRQGDIIYQHIGPAKWDDESVINFLRKFM